MADSPVSSQTHRLDWKRRDKYPQLGGISLEEWLLANHRGRVPSEIRPEIEVIVGHEITLCQVQRKCLVLKLHAGRDAISRVYRACQRARSRQPAPQCNPDAVWEAAERLAKELEYKVRYANEIEVDLSDEQGPVAIVELADLHIGGIGVDYDAIERDAAIIARTPGMYCTVGGDEIDNFINEFMIVGMATQVITASVQWRLLERHVGTIKDKVLYARVGNHDLWTLKRAEVDKFGELVASFGILNVGHIGVADIQVGQQRYVVEAAHRFWGKSRMNVFLTCMRLLDYGIAPDPDILLVEHEHTPAAGWFNHRGKDRYMVRPGTYKTKDAFAAEHHFYGAKVAPAVIIYWPQEYRLHLCHSVPEAAQYLTFLRQQA